MSVGACGGTDSPAPRPEAPAGAASRLVDPEAFARAVSRPGVVTINVHVPFAGSIAGTDASIPFDRIRPGASGLPPRTAALAVYCLSGNMSASAVREFAAMGYRDVVELEGGMNAWRDSGRALETRPPPEA